VVGVVENATVVVPEVMFREDLVQGDVVGDIPEIRVAHHQPRWFDGVGIAHHEKISVLIGDIAYRTGEVEQFFEVVIGGHGGVIHGFADGKLWQGDVSLSFHVAQNGVGDMQGGNVGPMSAQLGIKGIGYTILNLLEPGVDIDVVDAETVEQYGIKVGSGKVVFGRGNAVGQIFWIYPDFTWLQNHKECFSIFREDVLNFL